MHVTKPINLDLLTREMAAASVPVPNGLGHHGTDTDGEVYTFEVTTDLKGHPQGTPAELPAEAFPVVAAHVAPPVIQYLETITADRQVRTTDATVTEVFRFPTATLHVYRGTFQLIAVDAVSGTTKDSEARMTFKRGTGPSPAQVGSTVQLYSAADSGAASWAIQPSVSGADLVFSVQGAGGRTIDWHLIGEIITYAPAGVGS